MRIQIRSSYIIGILMAVTAFCMQSCQKNECDSQFPYKLDLSWETKEISAESHTIQLSVIEEPVVTVRKPYHANVFNAVKLIDKDGSPYFENPDLNDEESPTWIKIINEDGDSDSADSFTIQVDENETGKVRYAGICIRVNAPENPGLIVWGFAYIEQLPKMNNDDKTTETMRIRYHGETHSASYTIDSKGSYVFEDKKFESLLNRLTADENVEMLILDDEIVDFVDRDDEHFLDFTKTTKRSEAGKAGERNSTRAGADGFQFMKSGDLGYFAIFDKESFAGDNKYTGVTSFHNSFTLPNLTNYGLNDKVSSLAVAYGGDDPEVCAVLTIWEDADFNHGDNDRSKHRISIVASYYNRKVSRTNLKNVALLRASGNWNDRMSCICCHFGYYNRSLLDY